MGTVSRMSIVLAVSLLSIAAQGEDIARFAGSPEQRGLAQGNRFHREIRATVDAVMDTYFSNFFYKMWAKNKAREMEKFIPQGQIQELRGIATATGVDYTDLLIGNLLPDLSQLAVSPVGCSSFTVLPERSSTGGTIYGRNLDWHPELANQLRRVIRPVIFDHSEDPDGGGQILALTIPGMVGLITAINDRRVVLSMLYSYHEDQTDAGYPVSLLYRRSLSRGMGLEETMDHITASSPRTIAVNTAMADQKSAVILEMTSTRSVRRWDEGLGLVYAANHFESPQLIGRGEPERDYRWEYLSAHDQTQNRLGVAQVRRILRQTALNDESFVNILAVIVDFASDELRWGTSGEVAAAGPMNRIDLAEAFSGVSVAPARKIQ